VEVAEKGSKVILKVSAAAAKGGDDGGIAGGATMTEMRTRMKVPCERGRIRLLKFLH